MLEGWCSLPAVEHHRLRPRRALPQPGLAEVQVLEPHDGAALGAERARALRHRHDELDVVAARAGVGVAQAAAGRRRGDLQ